MEQIRQIYQPVIPYLGLPSSDVHIKSLSADFREVISHFRIVNQEEIFAKNKEESSNAAEYQKKKLENIERLV